MNLQIPLGWLYDANQKSEYLTLWIWILSVNPLSMAFNFSWSGFPVRVFVLFGVGGVMGFSRLAFWPLLGTARKSTAPHSVKILCGVLASQNRHATALSNFCSFASASVCWFGMGSSH